MRVKSGGDWWSGGVKRLVPGHARALVRLSNGRYKKIKVGDRIDGSKIAAIGETELHYAKSGRSITLTMPKG
ncbi:hypothetical protein [Thalassovita aquimarina]|uniref:Uncharacterized protein n=1 Tax=Thalassovita aquimarina TaxID=2785917 RepID=A0ABS5HQC5_9RHOB|nr:hypothetical protein [Thalassovita aquimarina]MBR9651174.1 hypothetical protein [Thalassovita aquimarina]